MVLVVQISWARWIQVYVGYEHRCIHTYTCVVYEWIAEIAEIYARRDHRIITSVDGYYTLDIGNFLPQKNDKRLINKVNPNEDHDKYLYMYVFFGYPHLG